MTGQLPEQSGQLGNPAADPMVGAAFGQVALPQPATTWAAAATQPATTRPVPGAEGLEYAGAIPRAAAYILDALAVTLATFVLSILLGAFRLPLLAALLLGMAIDLGYFVWGWTNPGRGTPAMGVFKLQIGRLADGLPLTAGTAVLRWAVVRGWIAMVSLFAVQANLAGGLSLVWLLILLLTMVADTRRLGLHDRIAGSAIVRPAGSSDTGAWVVIALFGLIPLLAIVAIVALIFLGSQASNILSQVGNSI